MDYKKTKASQTTITRNIDQIEKKTENIYPEISGLDFGRRFA